MDKIDTLKRQYDCDICGEILTDPVTLPCCGNNVCQLHLTKFVEKFNCELCLKEHPILQGGFAINKRMKTVLETELNTLRSEPVYRECETILEEVKQSASKLELIQTYTEEYLCEYFEVIKSEIRTRRDQLKNSIDEYSEGLIQNVREVQNKSIERIQEVDQLTSQIMESQIELENLVKKWDTFKINVENFKEIKANADSLKLKFDNMLINYLSSLMENQSHVLKYDDSSIDEIFGRVVMITLVTNLHFI